MNTKQKLLIVNEFHPETVKKLDVIYQTHKLWLIPPEQQQQFFEETCADCYAAATGSWICDERVYQLPQLRLISCFGVGVDGIDFAQTEERGISVSNTPDVLNDAVAEVAMGLILVTTRNMINADKFVRGQHWLEGPFPIGTSLANKTLGIVGLGRIGEAIAERAIAFKLKIAYHNRQQKPVTYQYCESLEQLASISDILLCMLPGGNATRNMINREVLRALGPNGILINVGRGSSVDEDALVQALQRGAIAGAGLDVFADEPNVPDALLKLDNIFLLPHIGSATLETRTAMGQLVIDNLQAFFNGDGILTPVHT